MRNAFLFLVATLWIAEPVDLSAETKNQTGAIDSVAVQLFAIDGIKEYPIVQDAAVTQKEDQLSLTVQVVAGTTLKAAKAAGDNFVRMVKGAIGDTYPKKLIGTGSTI
jgi:hypothetical protein